ncbi:MAG: hypothetical protein ACXW04_04445 [Methylobacter sp.]
MIDSINGNRRTTVVIVDKLFGEFVDVIESKKVKKDSAPFSPL